MTQRKGQFFETIGFAVVGSISVMAFVGLLYAVGKIIKPKT